MGIEGEKESQTDEIRKNKGKRMRSLEWVGEQKNGLEICGNIGIDTHIMAGEADGDRSRKRFSEAVFGSVPLLGKLASQLDARRTAKKSAGNAGKRRNKEFVDRRNIRACLCDL